MSRVSVGVGVVVWKGDRVLLVRRAKPPLMGAWSIPGGGLEYGERLEEAALRELREETGIEAEVLGLVDVAERIQLDEGDPSRRHMVLVDYAAVWKAGEARAGDDASDVMWASLETARERLNWSETWRIICDSRRFLDA